LDELAVELAGDAAVAARGAVEQAIAMPRPGVEMGPLEELFHVRLIHTAPRI